MIDDDRRRATDTGHLLSGLGWHAAAVAEARTALTRLTRERFSVVVVDAQMRVSESLPLLRAIRESLPTLAIVATVKGRDADERTRALELGADAVVALPATDSTIIEAVEAARVGRERTTAARVEPDRGRRADESPIAPFNDPSPLIGGDPLIESIRGIVARVASTRATVLITGESGTGKSLVAREIHRVGNRRERPFVEVACGALSDQLLESELFGHAAGAFTGATAAYAGRFLQADGGTIFLDEVGTASPAMQVKLLRVLQDRKFEPVGAGLTREVDVRLILATNDSLAERVAAGTFREDLFWRINVVTIHMPALRHRIGDVPRLAVRFAEEAAMDAGRIFQGFSDGAIGRLVAHDWPGNVRELRHAVERAVYLGDSSVISENDLQLGGHPASPLRARGRETPAGSPSRPASSSLREGLEEPERRLILEALARSGGCRREAARALGINRTSLYRKFKRLGIDPGSEIRSKGPA